MIKELMHDPIFLSGKSETVTKDDLMRLTAADVATVAASESP